MNLTKRLMVMALVAIASITIVARAATRGDINGDGVVNGADVTALYNVLLDGITVNGNPDVNQDNVVNGADVTALYNLLFNPQDNEDELFDECYATLRSKRTLNNTTLDRSYTSLIRSLWMLNELTTDEAHCLWSDEGIADLNHNSWNPDNPWIAGLFMRLCDNIDVCNTYLARDGHDAQHNAEVRLLRAYYYLLMMDLYGQAPFSTTTAATITSAPRDRAALFSFVESEVTAVEDALADSKQAGYGRLDKTAAHMLLARLYLNAEVYTGTPRWQDALNRAKSAIMGNYKIMMADGTQHNAFQLLFMGDNDTNGAQKEIVFPVIIDGNRAQAELDYHSTLYLVASTTNYDMQGIGTNQNWAGNRARKQFSQLFFGTDENIDGGHYNEWPTMLGDKRALFETDNHSVAIDNESSWSNGFPYVKWLAAYSNGNTPSNMNFVDTDFPIMRLTEASLIIAEADARLNGGQCTTEGLQSYNIVRMRAGAQAMRGASLNDILNEWGREFGFEGRRRTDLVRFGRYGGNHDYNWEWKNGNPDGAPFDATRDIFPIPSIALSLNPALSQNPGYDATPTAFTLTAPASFDFNNDDYLSLSWTASTITGVIAQPASYQLLLTNNDRSAHVTADLGNELTAHLTHENLQELLYKLFDGTTDFSLVRAQIIATFPGYSSRASNERVIALVNYKHTNPNPGAEDIYVVGYGNGWGTAGWVEPLHVTAEGVYTGFAYLNTEFILRSNENDWSGTNWYDNNGAIATEGVNFKVSTPGYYRITANFNTKTCTLDETINSIGIIGEQSGWSTDFATLTFNNETGAWEGTATIQANASFKFRANQDWTVADWGGVTSDPQAPGTLQMRPYGYDIKLTQAGTYRIQLWAWAETKARCVFTKL